MTSEQLNKEIEILRRSILKDEDDSSLLNSNDPYIIILYKIVRFVYLFKRDCYRRTILKTKYLEIWNRNLPPIDIQIITTMRIRYNINMRFYLIMKKKIILIHHKNIPQNLERIYDILKENY